MQVESTPLKGVLLIKPSVFRDNRGYFLETYHQQKFKQANINAVFVQDNVSISHKNVLRGLHFQKPPFAQAKLVQVLQGSALDVIVDLRKNSTTYGEHFKIVLNAEENLQVFIPHGFAHGFIALEDHTVFSYKCDNFYSPETQDGLLWNDADLKIDWHCENPIITEKDKEYGLFRTFVSPF